MVSVAFQTFSSCKNQSQYQWWKIPTKRKLNPKEKNHCIKLINTFCHYYKKKIIIIIRIIIIEWKVQSYIKKLTSSRESTGVEKKKLENN